MSDFDRRYAADARLTILHELARETSASLNEDMLAFALEREAGIRRSIEWVRTQLRKLAELGAVAIVETRAGKLIATLTRAGRDHVERRAVIDGVTRPADEV